MAPRLSPTHSENVASPDQYRFAAVLSPYRSLPPLGFALLMGAIGGVSFLAGLHFYRLGAWPVTGYFGLDVALLYLAFKVNYRAGRARELLLLSEDRLEVVRITPSGKRTSWTFNPYWARIRLEGDDKEDRTKLTLSSHGRELIIGGFLSNEERGDLAGALGRALAEAKLSPMSSRPSEAEGREPSGDPA
ncbi:MAG: DUF2244 domain-containing protein [Hyphomicrobiaceae bacterium]|nr:MAG: DUF2244 domain-containing protein [Hyphomicrobiaceae bacterium]